MGGGIDCSEMEKDIFDLIRSHARSFGNVVPRVAGGWVRDKLLGNPSFDMDIALENVSGYEFAAGLGRSATGQNVTEVHVIRGNPDKSKHLETAVVRINGFCVDFVNLRSETYSETRIPNVKPGTPEEDAFRRDLTINSLFYNLFTEEIEDYTGRGVRDIENRRLVTPLNPKITLLDDPLRLVRIFRFHSKLGFEVDEEIYRAAEDERVKVALEKKVSNERIYTEIFKIIHYPRGQYGLLEIIKRGYVGPIFKPPVERETSYEKGVAFCEVIEKVTNAWTRPYRKEVMSLYTVLCFFSRSIVPNRKPVVFSNAHIMKVSLSSSKSLVKMVSKVEENIAFLDKYSGRGEDKGDLIRILRFMGEMWYESAVIYSAIGHVEGDHAKYSYGLKIMYDTVKYKAEDYYLVRAVVDTSRLARDLGIPKKDTGFYIEESIVYQLLSGTKDPGEILRHLRNVKAVMEEGQEEL